MTFRAVLLGLLLGTALAAVGYFNDFILKSTYLAADLMPLGAYGLVLLGLLLVNPALAAVRLRRLAASEWAVMLSLLLAASAIPGPGLTWNFPQSLVVPFQVNRVNSGWQSKKVLEYAPEAMYPQVTPSDYASVVHGMQYGLRPKPDVPWYAWSRPLWFWLPTLSLSLIAAVCLAVVLHRQWSVHERLRYPIAEFAKQLLDGAEGGLRTSILGNRRFWWGFGPVLLICLINGYYCYNPKSVTIPLEFDFSPIYQRWPSLAQAYQSWHLTHPAFYFSVIGLAYFLGRDVSLSLGLNHFLFALVFLAILRAGIPYDYDHMAGGLHSYWQFGAALGLVMMVLYLGRRYYSQILLSAFGARRAPAVDHPAVWACRIGLLAATAMVAFLWFRLDLHPLWGTLFVLLAGIMGLAITRASAEGGLFFLQPAWQPITILLGIFGAGAMGPYALVAVTTLCTVLTIDPRVCMLPLAAHALQIGDRQGVSPGRLAGWLGPAVLLALAAGVFGTLIVQYHHGSPYPWTRWVGRQPFELTLRNFASFTNLSAGSQGVQTALFHTNGTFVFGLSVGIIMVPLLYFLRLRLPWWPIHPIICLVMGTFTGALFAWSFLAGWAAKTAISKFGGGLAYRNNKPLFIGMVAGEFTAAAFWAVVSVIYYLIAGIPGQAVRMHP